MNDFKLSDFTNKYEFIRKINGVGEASQSNPYVLTTDGTHSYWAAGGGGGGGGSVGILNTNNSSAQTPSPSESFSSNISLHKVSKTGNYDDLLNKPTIPSISNVSVTTGDSQTCGYFSGSISITSNSVTTYYNFIVNPARPLLSIGGSGEYSTENQGVVRPLYEIDRTGCKFTDTPELNSGFSYNLEDLEKQNIRVSLYGILRDKGEAYSNGIVLLPIVTIYRKNEALQIDPYESERVEAIPCIAFPSSIFGGKEADFSTFANELSYMYTNDDQIVYFDCNEKPKSE